MKFTFLIFALLSFQTVFGQHSKQATVQYWNACKQISDDLTEDLDKLWFAPIRQNKVGKLFIKAATQIKQVPRDMVDPIVVEDVNAKIVFFETAGYIAIHTGLQNLMDFALETGKLIPKYLRAGSRSRIPVPSSGILPNDEQGRLYEMLHQVRSDEKIAIKYIRVKYQVELMVW